MALADVAQVKKGEPSPFDGYVFDPKSEEEARTAVRQVKLVSEEAEALRIALQGQEHISQLHEKRANLYFSEVENLSKRVIESSGDNFWRNALYFLSGAVITGAVAYGLSAGVGR